MKKLNLTNDKFGRLTVISPGPKIGQKTSWICKCDCGNTKTVLTTNLTKGKTSSCGCLHNELLTIRNTTHNMRKTSLYEVWKSIKQRCFNPKSKGYVNYGGRGIIMCEIWKNNFESFYQWSISNGYKKGLTIDRIDNNGNYEPSNCRWVDRFIQNNNTRQAKLYTISGVTKTLSEWCNIYNVNRNTIKNRMQKYSCSIEEALHKKC